MRFHRTLIPSLALALLVQSTGAFHVQAQEDVDGAPVNAVAFFDQAQDLHEKGKFEEAIKLYNKAIEAVAEFPEAEYQRADAYLSLGNLEESEKSVRLAVSHRADWSLALAKLGEILVRRHSLASPTDAVAIRAEASDFLKRAILSDAGNFPAYAALVDLQLGSNETASVLRTTLASVKRLTDGKSKVPASIWSARAALEDRLKIRDASRLSVAAALATDPKSLSALLLAAQFALNDGDVELASSRYAALRNVDALSPASRLLEVRVLAAEGKVLEARKALDALGTKSAEAEGLRSELALRSTTTSAELEALLEKDPTNAPYLSRLCEINRVAAPAKALDFCRRAAEAQPDNIAHAVGFAAALVQARRFDQAIVLLSKLIAIAPDNVTARANLAMAYFQSKRFPEAKAEYAWIATRHPERAVVHFLLGVTHDNLGEYLDAMANYQQFLRVADSKANQLEIEKVNLRLPTLQKLIRSEKGKK